MTNSIASFKSLFKSYLLRQTLPWLDIELDIGYSLSQHLLCSFHSTFLILWLCIYLFTCLLSSLTTRKVHQWGQEPFYLLRIQDPAQCHIDSRSMWYVFVEWIWSLPLKHFLCRATGHRKPFRKYLVEWFHNSTELSQRNYTPGSHSGRTIHKITGNIQEYYFYQQRSIWRGPVAKETSQENKFCVHCV